MSGPQKSPGEAPAADLANQRAIAAGLKPAKSKANNKGTYPMSNEHGQNDQPLTTEVSTEQVETVNQELPTTGLDQVDFTDDAQQDGVELESEEGLGETLPKDELSEEDAQFLEEDEDVDAPDADQYEGDVDEVDPETIFNQASLSALMPNYASHKINPALVCTFNLVTPEMFENTKEQLVDVEVVEGKHLNYWSPFQRKKEGSVVEPAFAGPLRLVIQYLKQLPNENLTIIAENHFGSQIGEMLSSHVGQLVSWKLLNTHVDTEANELEGITLETEDGPSILGFNELIDAEGYSSIQSDNGLEAVSNAVVNVSMQIPSLYFANNPASVSVKLVELISRMAGDLPCAVAFAFNADTAIVDPDLRNIVDALVEYGFTVASRETLELSLGEEPILPEVIQPTTSEALDSLFLHGGDLLLVADLAAMAEGGEE